MCSEISKYIKIKLETISNARKFLKLFWKVLDMSLIFQGRIQVLGKCLIYPQSSRLFPRSVISEETIVTCKIHFFYLSIIPKFIKARNLSAFPVMVTVLRGDLSIFVVSKMGN